MTPLQQLEQKIFDKLPELKKLGVGCEVMIDGKVYTVDDKFVSIQDNNELNTIMGYYFDWEYTIIGKPPTLVDVLKYYLSIKDDSFLFVSENSNIFLGIHKESRVEWNLNSIYLRDQSPELINFLINLNK